MTKQERLQELKQEKQFHKVLDKYFDKGWREFVKSVQGENDISNIRMFKTLSAIRGNDFVADLIQLMGKKNKHALLRLSKNPKGIPIKDNRFATIPELLIYKYTAGAYREGEVYVKVREGTWIWFVF